MSGHEKEEWEKELGWIGLGWAELQCRWSDRGVGQQAGSRSYASTPTAITDAKERKDPDCATAWSDLTQLSKAAKSSYESKVLLINYTLFI